MKPRHALRIVPLWLGLCTAALAAGEAEPGTFVFDAADTSVQPAVAGGPNDYDADLVPMPDGLWMTWLAYEPGKGDRLCIGRLGDDGKIAKVLHRSEPGAFTHPTLTRDGKGQLWLTHEWAETTEWNVWVHSVDATGKVGEGRLVSESRKTHINHRVAAAPDGGIRIVWQSDHDGQFEVLMRRVEAERMGPVELVSTNSPTGDWHPDLAVMGDDTVCVVWDSYSPGYDGVASFNVYARMRSAEGWGPTLIVADGPGFEGRARVAADPQADGGQPGFWIAWEEGASHWGEKYVPEMRLKNQEHMIWRDALGPLHRFRLVRLARLSLDGQVRAIDVDLAMPMVRFAQQRPAAPEGVAMFGAYYERPVISIDERGRLWVVYRQCYAPWYGIDKISHKEEGWGVYARCWTAGGWSKLTRLVTNQGDGMQRLEVLPHDGGLTVAYTSGRTDRREPDDRPRGVVLAEINAEADGPAPPPSSVSRLDPRPPVAPEFVERPKPATMDLRGQPQHLFFGDLHRHTDLSLCFVFCDGTIDDAYRYAIEVDRLDFLGITDHARDLDRGEVLSQLWWRSVKEVDRHTLAPSFLPYYAYERSRGGADHNVISLRRDVLTPFTYPHAKFWTEIDDDTITIPHQTITKPISPSGEMPTSIGPEVWSTHDEKRRPLMEVYQGCRHRAVMEDAHQGLRKGYRFGFIASSDHLATSCSYAGVWAPERTREAIFRAMQARRTFGATARIPLVVNAGDTWMGEEYAGSHLPPLRIRAAGTAIIRSVDIIVDGALTANLAPNAQAIDMRHAVELNGPGRHFIYVSLEQTDGNRAWSSPIWVDLPQSARR